MSDNYIEMIIDENAVNHLEEAIIKSLKQTADFIVGDTIQNQYIPFDYGTLQNSRYIYVDYHDNAIIEHNTPYAERVYYGDDMNFQTVNNRNARSRWYKEYEEQGQHYDRVERFFANRIKLNSERYVE